MFAYTLDGTWENDRPRLGSTLIEGVRVTTQHRQHIISGRDHIISGRNKCDLEQSLQLGATAITAVDAIATANSPHASLHIHKVASR